jgi:hypothetical protein
MIRGHRIKRILILNNLKVFKTSTFISLMKYDMLRVLFYVTFTGPLDHARSAGNPSIYTYNREKQLRVT